MKSNRLLYIFDYDDTLKSENGMCPNTNIFVELVNSVKRETELPMIILTSGFARNYDTIFSSDRRMMRPIDYIRDIGLKYTENIFEKDVDVCVFDINHSDHYLQKEFGHPLIDNVGRKNLASLNFIIYLKYGFNTNMILFDDLPIHSIDSKNTRIGMIDPFSKSDVMYIKVKKLGKSERDSCERIKTYTKVVESSSIERSNRIFTIWKYRGQELLLKII